MNAGVRPARLPAIEIGLRRLNRLEAKSLQWRLLCVPNAGFDFAFAIGIADTAREPDDAVVREHIAIERIQCGIVDVWREHAFFQVIEVMCPRRICGGDERARGARPRSAHSIATSADGRTCASNPA